MFENKEKIYEIILTIAVFFFLLFCISILRNLFVYTVYVGDLIYTLLFFLEFLISIILSYKFYKIIHSKVNTRKKGILLSILVTIVFYAYLSALWIIIFYSFSQNASNVPKILGSILTLAGVFLFFISIAATPFLGYKFYLFISNEEVSKELKAREKNFLNRDQEQTTRYFEHNSQLRDKWNQKKTKFLLLYALLLIILAALSNFLSLGIDLGLILKCLFLLTVIIFLEIYDKKMFMFEMILISYMVLVFLFHDLSKNGFFGLSGSQMDSIFLLLLFIGIPIVALIGIFWYKNNVE